MRTIISFISEKALLLSHSAAQKRTWLPRRMNSNTNVTQRGTSGAYSVPGWAWLPLTGPSRVGRSLPPMASRQPKSGMFTACPTEPIITSWDRSDNQVCQVAF